METSTLPTPHFLIVDDDAECRTTMVELLRSMGYTHVTLAHDGAEALRFLDRDSSINFVISDWEMPLVNGFSLLQKMKSRPDLSQIPFVVITSPGSLEKEKVTLAGSNMADGYLIKPFRSIVLKERIEKCLASAALGERKQVVVVDDNPETLETILEYLKQIGFKEIITLTEGASALNHVLKEYGRIGLIISDWEMPQLSGIDFLRSCKSNPLLREIPFLMVTSQSSLGRVKVSEAAQLHVDEFLLKPFSLKEFRLRILHMLSQNKSFWLAKGLIDEGSRAIESGHFQSGYSKFEEAYRLFPQNEMVLRGMAEMSLKLKGPQSAVPYYKKALELNPLHSPSYIKLAFIYDSLGWGDRAIALLANATRHIRDNAELHLTLGKMYYKNKMIKEAIQPIKRALELRKDYSEARTLFEKIQHEQKDLQVGKNPRSK